MTTQRLDWLVKAPDWLLMDPIEHGECPWCLLAIPAGYVELGLLGKYLEGVDSVRGEASSARGLHCPPGPQRKR